ncbi:PASTA domain-containing protein [Streptomyces microflavus]|uniref:PASTA domain-containing protein n=1 Tax=Streptomyces microflavus TaxID=1919 RepID=UPI0036E936B2
MLGWRTDRRQRTGNRAPVVSVPAPGVPATVSAAPVRHHGDAHPHAHGHLIDHPHAPPDPVMPALHSRTYEQARAELARAGVSTARLKPGAQHKDVTVPRDHDGWYICDTSPRPGAPVTAATTVTVRLARDFSDCTTSFNGYLHQENDPAHTP